MHDRARRGSDRRQPSKREGAGQTGKIDRGETTQDDYVGTVHGGDGAQEPQPARLSDFFEKLGSCGAYPEYLRSLILRWDTPTGKKLNLGYFKKNGEVWTDAINWGLPHHLSHAYIEDLAEVFGAEVDKTSFNDGNWHVRMDGAMPRIEQIMDKFDGWYTAIEKFVVTLQEHYSGAND